MSVPQTIRKPNFHADVKTYGKIGERFFQDSISSGLTGKGKVMHDVSDNPFWQQYDVDFVISDEGVSLNSVDSELFDENLIRLEVKVDTVAPRTGNLAYEVISHGKFGWCVNTMADKVIMLICNDGIIDGKIYAYEGHIIDMKKWKSFWNREQKKNSCCAKGVRKRTGGLLLIKESLWKRERIICE